MHNRLTVTWHGHTRTARYGQHACAVVGIMRAMRAHSSHGGLIAAYALHIIWERTHTVGMMIDNYRLQVHRVALA